ncbi:hypothetical protein [Bradyrhizobium sp. BR 10289]|uniref:hypothetical protein n=1 Tax=Bradyrhizobium sp. BR 10289 TaxID=2749993 RepID=UPI001E4D2F42|nr:hypothetical protein [Bradyrhizobium sp. BR 10289]
MSIPTRRADSKGNHSRAGQASRYVLALMLCAAYVIPFANGARAQCAARDVLQRQLGLKLGPAQASQQSIKSARDVATWKTIMIGTFADPIKLRNALDRMGCNVGGRAAEIIARPTFAVASQKTAVELVTVSPAELGVTSDAATLADVYARAGQLGFELAAAEVGPQLRLQYLDQPIGEFLIVGMEPIKTWSGEPIILNVANGGAGLILIGQDGSAGAEIPATSRFIFARAHRPAAGAGRVEEAAVLLPR